MQGTLVPSLFPEDPIYCRATKPVKTATEPTCSNYWSPHTLELVLHKRSHCNEKPELQLESGHHLPQLGKALVQQQ